ncbi:hypothetical protein GCM10027517_21690 [Phycicoccus ginsengisoli]
MAERHEPGAPAASAASAASARSVRLPLPHDPPPPPGYVDPLGDGGVLSDLTADADEASRADTDEDA